MTSHSIAIAGVLVVVLGAPAPAPAQVDQGRAATYFDEADSLCQRAGDRLWGLSLCGPMVFADPLTSTIATNAPVPAAARPPSLGYANAAMTWGDDRWSTYVWQMIPDDDAHLRARLFMHELFHRIQPELGLYIPTSDGENDHLETLDGRVWMQLEWRALSHALASSGDTRLRHVRDALAFRRTRREAFPGASEAERASEINEGLAQYTGTVLAFATRDEAIADAIEQLARAPEKESFVRTFAYPSGAAYGLLLDVWSPGWTRRIEVEDDLGRLVEEAVGPVDAIDPETAARRYDVVGLRRSETARAEAHARHVAGLRARFVDGPVVVMPRGTHASFISNGVTPIPGAGTLYPSYRVTGTWGRLEAAEVLVSLDGSTLAVPAPAAIGDTLITGHGWTISLAPGWVLQPGDRPGDHRVSRPDD